MQNYMQKLENVFFSLFKILKDYYAPKCTKLEYTWIKSIV